jgi:hypothetical protein
LVEHSESVWASDLLQLGPQALDLGAELDLELGVLRLICWEVILCLIERDESVLDAACELGLWRRIYYYYYYTKKWIL